MSKDIPEYVWMEASRGLYRAGTDLAFHRIGSNYALLSGKSVAFMKRGEQDLSFNGSKYPLMAVSQKTHEFRGIAHIEDRKALEEMVSRLSEEVKQDTAQRQYRNPEDYAHWA